MAQLLNQEMEIFLQKFDTDGDGRISMDEIESFLKQNGKGNTAGSGANGAMTANDLDGNGFIDGPEEIAAFMKKSMAVAHIPNEKWLGLLPSTFSLRGAPAPILELVCNTIVFEYMMLGGTEKESPSSLKQVTTSINLIERKAGGARAM
ncbi:hypothetical protein NE237_008542 [Protea cynaroides]|uniref:EF-hand domain-containing protein n=1 Tax=Protea cynaroides TaxID=273540 RepID=A0A9Q0KW27_9MAGN|nr:hypothetical protein NE237_008542 [Protea cynaroides]